MGMKCYFVVVLICICLMANDIQHLFMYLLAICVYFLGEMSIQILCPILIGLCGFLLSCKSSLHKYSLDTSALSDI